MTILALVSGCTSPDSVRQPVLFSAVSPAVLVASADFVQQVSADSEQLPEQAEPAEKATPETPLPSTAPPLQDRYPIDLATALRLAGANNLQIALAAERVREAQARLEGAEVLWMPSVNAGVQYHKHEGRIQDTQGQIVEVSRNALFGGGGATLGTIGAAGASTQPRMTVGLALADILFAPLVERQLVQATDAAFAATFNDTLLQVALAYEELVQAQTQVAIAHEAIQNAEELLRLVEARVRTGLAPPADALRARAELAERRRQAFQAEEAVRTVSAELVRLLRLDPTVTLFAVEPQPVPIHLIEADVPLPVLLAQGLTNRPELAQHQALVSATLERLRQEQWRPWIPTLQLGVGAGGFGGGEGAALDNFSDRTDVDALAVWELRNLGFGNRALKHERTSQYLQASLTAEQIRDAVAAEITTAYYQVQFRRQQLEAAREQVQVAAEALPLNFEGVRGAVLRAIEALQAVQTLAAARSQYLDAVIAYNRAQFQLLRAIGQSLDSPACHP